MNKNKTCIPTICCHLQAAYEADIVETLLSCNLDMKDYTDTFGKARIIIEPDMAKVEVMLCERREKQKQ